MKLRFLVVGIILLSLFLISIGIKAQYKGFDGGVYLGITGTTFKGEQNLYIWNYNGKTKSSTSYNGGIYVNRAFFHNNHKFRFEMRYVRKGALAYSPITSGPAFERLILHYVELPLLYEQPFYFNEDKHFLYFGLSYGILVKKAMNTSGDLLYSELDSPLRENDYCWNIGYKLPFLKNSEKFYLLLTLSRSFRSIHEKYENIRMKVYNRTVGINLNYEL